MPAPARAFFGAALGFMLLRLVAAGSDAPLWGINHLYYLDPPAAAVWVIGGVILLFPLLCRRTTDKWRGQTQAWSARAVGVAFYLGFVLLPTVGSPLLGDGMDRLEATVAGFKSLKGQPAPLDLLLHLVAFQLWNSSPHDPLTRAWKIWQFFSHAAGGSAAFFLWKLALLRGRDRLERRFLFLTVLLGGTVLFFLGYVENYVILAAGIYGYLCLFELVAEGRAKAATLFWALLVLIGLHFFMILLLPGTLYALFKHRIFRPGKIFLAVCAVVAAAFSAVALVMVREHYGGLAAIWVRPRELFGSYHLGGFINQQLLACPVLPLLLPLAFFTRTKGEPDPLLSFLGISAFLFLIFFFFLRPVIGPAMDWDLFALPSLLYAPFLVLRSIHRLRHAPAFPAMAWAVVALTVVSTGPWVSINLPEAITVRRFRDLLETEASHNSWAASYGYLRLGKYLGRHPFERHRPEVFSALARALELSPQSLTLRLQVAQTYENVGRRDLARKQMLQYFILKARHDRQLHRWQDAEKSLLSALEIEPNSFTALSQLLDLYTGPLPSAQKAREYQKRLEEITQKP